MPVVTTNDSRNTKVIQNIDSFVSIFCDSWIRDFMSNLPRLNQSYSFSFRRFHILLTESTVEQRMTTKIDKRPVRTETVCEEKVEAKTSVICWFCSKLFKLTTCRINVGSIFSTIAIQIPGNRFFGLSSYVWYRWWSCQYAVNN